MKKRIPVCMCLVGWEDVRMTKPKRCRKRAGYMLQPYRIPACTDHVKWNAKKALTFVPPDGVMIGAMQGSAYERIGDGGSRHGTGR